MSDTNKQDKQIITDIITYMSKVQSTGLIYCEAIDETTTARLTLSITGESQDETKEKIPAPIKRVTIFSHKEEDKDIIKKILDFLNKNQTTGFSYKMEIPGLEQTIDIKVTLEQIDS